MAGLAGSQPQNLASPELNQFQAPKAMPPLPKQEGLNIPVIGQNVNVSPSTFASPQSQVPAGEPSDDDLLASIGAAPQKAAEPSDADLLSAIGAAPSPEAAPDVTPDELTAYAIQHKKELMQQVPTALEAVGRVLDYPGGHIRTAAAETYDLLNTMLGNKPIVTNEDVLNALKGKAPSSAEYLGRAGMTEGPSVMIPGTTTRISTRDAIGFALDLAADPLTELSNMVKQVPYIGKLVRGGGLATEAMGDWIYSSAFKKVDAKLAAKGVEPFSEVMRNGVFTKEAAQTLEKHGIQVPEHLTQGVAGTTMSVAEKADAMSNAVGKVRQAVYEKADQLGAKVNLGAEGTFKKAEGVIANMKKDPGLRPQAEALEEMLGRYKAEGPVSLANASDFKSNLYDALPNTAFDGFGKLKAKANQFKLALASDLKDAIVKSGNGAERGLGDAVDHINERWGILLEARKPMQKQTTQAAGQGLGSWIDGVILGSGHVSALAAKKAMELAGTTAARTYVGKAISDAGRSGLVDAMLRRSLTEQRMTPLKPTEEPQQ